MQHIEFIEKAVQWSLPQCEGDWREGQQQIK
eukprot:CAMPEP_0173299590 /NCGR_PEP_ID=MMETSP1143-20121109/16762_1 /TAXON_ID=483371 /ORGANISM="non described non described, Strain CCMP2298" /LENGTH=30 /DNA_ID= /DNA_START= /DNA_END= /DNA_ORIENTATION=